MSKFLFFCCFYCFIISSRGQEINWIKEHTYRYDDINNHFGNVISSDKYGNIYCGSLLRVHNNDPANPSGSYLRKYNQKGELVWEKFYKITDIMGLVTDSDGSTYIAGIHAFDLNFGCGEMNAPNSNPAFLAKLDSNGNCLWSKEVTKPADTNYDEPWFSKLILDKSEQFFYMIGRNAPENPKECFPYINQGSRIISKFDSNGNCIWTKIILTNKYISNIAVNDKYLAVTGSMFRTAYFGMDSSAFLLGGPGNSLDNVFTALYDLDGNFLWAKQTAKGAHEGNSITVDKENNFYVTGFLESGEVEGRKIGAAYHNGFAVKYNAKGDTIAVAPLIGPNFEEGRAIYAGEDGVYWSGTFYNELNIADTTIFTGKSGSFLCKMSVDLRKVIWIKILNGGGHTEIFKIDEDKQGNLIACGSYEGFLEVDGWRFENNGYKTPFVLSLKDTTPAPPITTSILKKNTGTDFQIFPNPIQSIFTIYYQSEQTGSINLKVRNLAGSLIHESVYMNQTGIFQKQLDLSNKAPGLYFIELVTDRERLVKKVVINH